MSVTKSELHLVTEMLELITKHMRHIKNIDTPLSEGSYQHYFGNHSEPVLKDDSGHENLHVAPIEHASQKVNHLPPNKNYDSVGNLHMQWKDLVKKEQMLYNSTFPSMKRKLSSWDSNGNLYVPYSSMSSSEMSEYEHNFGKHRYEHLWSRDGILTSSKWHDLKYEQQSLWQETFPHLRIPKTAQENDVNKKYTHPWTLEGGLRLHWHELMKEEQSLYNNLFPHLIKAHSKWDKKGKLLGNVKHEDLTESESKTYSSLFAKYTQ
jgi:hypothetical protein